MGCITAIGDTIQYFRCLFYLLVYPGFSRKASGKGGYEACPYFKEDKHAKVQCYSLALIFYLWSKPHYRNGTFQDDMIKNLRNVAIPGTGIPLSLFCWSRLTALPGLLFLNPLICFMSAINSQAKTGRPWAEAYSEQLLRPRDWFSFWRLNCRLASYHACETGCTGYRQEDKWTFIQEGMDLGVPVTPVLDIPALVIKDKNEEGGMGIFFYKNALNQGDWIIQERLENSTFLSELLPPNAPLSTMRIITASRWWLDTTAGKKPGASSIDALSCVFRAGMEGASTDHSSILFDVDVRTGDIKEGTTNAHWYNLGLGNGFKTNWLSSHDITSHPDTGNPVTGKRIPDLDKIANLVRESHFKMLPDVPLVGWDVALTPSGALLLEVNLSCNFFRGSFDLESYVNYVDDYFRELEKFRGKKKDR
ncbi:unnamed protein product [Chrysoparadoxa australica]